MRKSVSRSIDRDSVISWLRENQGATQADLYAAFSARISSGSWRHDALKRVVHGLQSEGSMVTQQRCYAAAEGAKPAEVADALHTLGRASLACESRCVAGQSGPANNDEDGDTPW